MSGLSVTINAFGASPAVPVPSYGTPNNGAVALVNVTPQTPGPLLPTIIITISSDFSGLFELDWSNDGVNWAPDPTIVNYSASVIFTTSGYAAYWRLNCTSYSSGSITATYANPAG